MLAEDTSVPIPTDPPAAMSDTELVVAVLPFDIIGDADPVLIDGVIEEITNGLARFRTVTVIARLGSNANRLVAVAVALAAPTVPLSWPAPNASSVSDEPGALTSPLGGARSVAEALSTCPRGTGGSTTGRRRQAP